MQLTVGTQVRTTLNAENAVVIGVGNNEWMTRIRKTDGTIAIVEDSDIYEIDEDEKTDTFRDRLGRYSEALKGTGKMIAYTALALFAVVLIVIAFKYHATPQKDTPEAVTVTNELNALNLQRTPLLESCKQLRETEKEIKVRTDRLSTICNSIK